MADEIEKFVDVPDGFLYCQTRGQGQDVILVNAGHVDLRMWEVTVSWLSQIARVTTFDYRDTGLSSPGVKPYSEIEDIAAVMDASSVLSPSVLVGVSDGARRALAFAHRYRIEIAPPPARDQADKPRRAAPVRSVQRSFVRTERGAAHLP